MIIGRQSMFFSMHEHYLMLIIMLIIESFFENVNEECKYVVR